MRISDWSSDVCSSDLMAADDPEITGVGAEGEIEQVACYGNRAKRGIDRRIDAHARKLPLRHAKIARFPDGITRQKRRHDITDHGYQADNGVKADRAVDAGNNKCALKHRTQRSARSGNRRGGTELRRTVQSRR